MVRFQVALSLGDLEDPRAISALASIAARDGADRWVRVAIQSAINKGKIDEALAGIGNLHAARDRANMIGQMVNRIGAGQKRETVLSVLEQVRRMLGVSRRAEDQDQLNALLQTGMAFSQFDSGRAFEIIEVHHDYLCAFGAPRRPAIHIDFAHQFLISVFRQIELRHPKHRVPVFR